MRTSKFFLVIPFLFASCVPEAGESQASVQAPIQPSARAFTDKNLHTQGDRISRLETELHEIRLLFTNQNKRIEEIAHSASTSANYSSQVPPQQVVIMPSSPVVTHRWDQPTSRHQASQSSQTHVIQSGDTLSEIAHAHGISAGALLAANPGTNPLRLRIGRKLTIPSQNFEADFRQKAITHRIQAGDTLSEIAQQHSISLAQLQAANLGVDPLRLRIGKELQIPSASFSAPTQASPQAYHHEAVVAEIPPPAEFATPQEFPPAKVIAQLEEPQEIEKKILIRIPSNSSLGEIANKVGTNVSTLNRLNHCALSASSRIPANGTLYVPAPTN